MAISKEKWEHTNICVRTQNGIWQDTYLLVKPSKRMSLVSLIWECFLDSLVCRFWFLLHLEKEHGGCDWGWWRRCVSRMACLGRWRPEGVHALWALSGLHRGRHDKCACFVFWWGQGGGWQGSETVPIQKDSLLGWCLSLCHLPKKCSGPRLAFFILVQGPMIHPLQP